MSDQPTLTTPASLEEQVATRRTFAIISHPDAGKTTLTEKLLLYGNAIHLAGSVRARRNQRNTRSDWMKIERERGISITSTVLQFPYRGYTVNLLDTPGHADFSEDTYRTLAATDSAVMVLDAAKGVEPQTRKLFDVCRQRGIPVFTFINKMDRPARDPLSLLDEIETVLGMQPVPMTWPIGDGPGFKGVYHRLTGYVHLYERTAHNQTAAHEQSFPVDAPELKDYLTPADFAALETGLELLDGLGITFDHELVLAGQQTPVYFGSALINFGVQLFLDGFVDFAPPPATYVTDSGPVDPTTADFSGFVFKIQANMNPRHRDSVAFLRICSGRFERNMAVNHPRTGRTVRLPRPYAFFAEERSVIEEAYPGDIIGLPNNGDYAIGDTLVAGKKFNFAPIPRFQPEHFAALRNPDIGKQKNFIKGLQQLQTEGAMQIFYYADGRRDPILGVVGILQFDVVQARLADEYGVETTLEALPSQLARWVSGDAEQIEDLPWGHGLLRTRDDQNRLVALFRSQHDLNYCIDRYPKVAFSATG